MKKYLAFVAVILALVVLLAGALPVAAADNTTITVTSSVPLLIDGVVADKLPTIVVPGTTVSITGDIVYTSSGDRWTFQGWSDGSTGDSITPTEPGTYTAIYAHAVLFQISCATVPSLWKSMWVPYGQPLQVTAPELVQAGDNTRYRFQMWSGGETPFQINNTIAPFQPMALEAKYATEYLFTVQSPENIPVTGTGWYTSGTSLVLQASQDVYDDARTSREDFDSWESTGSPVMVLANAKSAVMTVKIDGPYTLKANYNKQYLVVANSPFGTLKNEWVNENDQVQLEAQAVVEIIPEAEQYVFQRWTGMEGLVSPKVSGTVTAPVQLMAVYEHQYAVTLNAPNGGTGDGWYKAGSVATIMVPDISQKGLFQRSTFAGFAGYSGSDTTIQVIVQGPTTVTANYSSGLDLRVMGMIIGVVLVLVLAGLGAWVLVGRRRGVG